MALQIDVVDGTGRRGRRPPRCAERDVEGAVPHGVRNETSRRRPPR